MANKPRITVARPFIINELEKLRTNVFDANMLNDIFETNKDKWRLPLSMDLEGFMEALSHQDFINYANFDFPGLPHRRIFFNPGASVYEISALAVPRAYLSHYSAVSLWGLTEQIPKTIYITQEQSASPAKAEKGELSQQGIDVAFRKPQRQSETFVTLNEYKIILLRGKATKNLGVGKLEADDTNGVNITDIERTLLDIVVRPSYAGGVFEVLKAFRNANEQNSVSANRLSNYLSRIDYLYPYHQAIGFYLTAAGNYKESQIRIFKNIPQLFDFYLAYDMQNMEYSKEWRIYYPKGMI